MYQINNFPINFYVHSPPSQVNPLSPTNSSVYANHKCTYVAHPPQKNGWHDFSTALKLAKEMKSRPSFLHSFHSLGKNVTFHPCEIGIWSEWVEGRTPFNWFQVDLSPQTSQISPLIRLWRQSSSFSPSSLRLTYLKSRRGRKTKSSRVLN